MESTPLIVLIIFAAARTGESNCCHHGKFILDYVELYSLSHVAIIAKAGDADLSPFVKHLSVAYISYDHSDLEQVAEYISSIRGEIEALFFLGTDHSTLIGMLDNQTDIFHSKVMSIMDHHPTTEFRLRLDTNILTCRQEGKTYILAEDYAIKGGPKISAKVGSWSEESGLEVSQPLLYERRSDLKNVELTNTVMPWPGLTNNYIFDKDGEVVLRGGLYVDVLRDHP